MDRDGNTLQKLTKGMNGEENRSSLVIIQRDQEIVTGKDRAAHCFIDSFEQVSNNTIPNNRKQQVHDEIKNHETDQDPPECMNCPFSTKGFKEAMKTLKDLKSGSDKITNEMLEYLGTKANPKLLGIFNNSWKTGHVPQSWREADMVPIHKKDKDQANTDSYRPIRLTSCVDKLMERLINTRLVWHPEKNNNLTPRAGRLSAAPFYLGPGGLNRPQDRGWLPG